MTFSTVFDPARVRVLVSESLTRSEESVARALGLSRFSLDNFATLISPAAQHLLEPLAQRAHQLTVQRFGRTMQLFIPMYLSNECSNRCTYCGFSVENKFPRRTLTLPEIVAEGRMLAERGFRHLLILTGESPRKVGVPYIASAIDALALYFSSIGVEIQPLETNEYSQLIHSGADSLTVYQETYDPEAYKKFHLSGKKKDYTYRLDTPDRGGKADFPKMNIGALLGLADWRFEAISLAWHIHYLSQRYWRSKLSISFPRITEMFREFSPDYLIHDRDLTQLILAFRLSFPDLGISLSTREPATLRDHLIPLGVTQMSAESMTSPGGYSGVEAEPQFQTTDHRSLAEVTAVLQRLGYDSVVKDWDPALRT